MDFESFIPVITAVIGLVTTYVAGKYGVKYQQSKDEIGKLAKLLQTIYDAAKDDKITEEEFQQIVDEAKALVDQELQ